jgi:hypothetical protein
MSDDLTKKGPQDRSRINIHEAWEVEYWCRELGCSHEELVAVVKLVGVMAADVRKYFGK